MFPTLFHFFSIPIHSYGLMLAISFLFGIWLSGRRARKRGLDPNVVTDVGFWVILSAIVGSRLYYVFLHFEEFTGNPLDIINPFQGGTIGIGGLVMFGGFIGAIAASIIFFSVKKLPFLPYADVIAPSIGFGIFFTRIGCFLNGCCYGKVTNHSFGMEFPADSPAGAYQLEKMREMALELGHQVSHCHLHPSQLYSSLGGLIIALVVLLIGRKRLFDGLEFYSAGLLYTVSRFLVDYTRFYGPTEKLGSLSHNQVVCIILFIVFTGLILKESVFSKLTTSPEKQEVDGEEANAAGP